MDPESPPQTAPPSPPPGPTPTRADLVRLVELAADAVALLDRGGAVRYLSPRAEALSGVARAAALGRPAWEALPPAGGGRFAREFSRIIAAQDAAAASGGAAAAQAEWTEWTQWLRGMASWLHFRLVAPRPGEPVYLFIRDVTAQTEAESDRAAARAALGASEERFRRIAESAREIVSLTDAAGRFVYLNPAVADVLGYAPSELLGRTASLIVHPDDLPRLADLQAGADRCELRARRRDGGTVWLEASSHRIAVGGAAQTVAVARDVSARRAADEETARLLERQTRIVETLQRSLLVFPTAGTLPGLEVACEYAAASDDLLVGGDFFDAFPLTDGRAALVVGDVSGKGLESAARTAEAKFALRAFLREDADPGRALSRLNAYVRQCQAVGQYDSELLIAVAVAVTDTRAGTVEVASAGLDPPLLLRPETGQSLALEAGGLPIGADGDAAYPVVRGILEAGDLLFLFTDGLTEARRRAASGRWEFLGYGGVSEAARKAARGEADLYAVGATVVAAARAFAGGTLQDDACLLLARLHP